MGVPFDTFKAAVSDYIEEEIVRKAPLNRRILLGAAALVAPAVLEQKYQSMMPYLMTLGLVDDQGTVNVDRLEEVGVDLVRRYGSFQMKVLDVGVSIGEDDVRKLATLCRSAQA